MANVNKTGGQPRVQQTQDQQKIKNTKKQIGQITHTILQLVPNDSSTKTKITRIAQELYDYADSHNGAIGQEGFSKLMKEITSLNVVGVILKYNELYNSSTSSFADNETLVETILDETSSSREDIREALLGDGKGKNKIRGLFTLLLDRAKEVGMDDNTIQSYRKQFETKLNKELNGGAAFRSSASMDEIINTVIQSIRNHIEENNKAAKANGSQKTVPAKAHETKATNTIVARYNKALKDFNKQLKADGWAEDIADAMGRLWGKNYADAVRKDLRAARKDIDRLKAALAKGDEAFRTEFLNIFGIAYDPANITAYKNAENAYTTALKAKSNEDSFNQAFNVLLKNGELKAEYETLTYPDTGVRTTATKEQVYQREFKKVAELFEATVKNDKSGQFAALGVTDGKSYVEKAIESAGAKGKSIDEKYKVLQNIVGKISQSLAQETKKACGGRSFSSIKTQYENCYKAAYGLENDILKRVTDYNISQQKGGGAVKGAVVAIAAIGLGILTAGGGTAAVAGGTGAATTAGTAGGTMAAGAIKGAATVSALTAITELSDKLTSKNGLRPEDIGQIAQASLVSGTMCLMFAGQSYAITNLTLKAATAAGMGAEAAGYTAATLSTAGFVGTGLGTEYIFQGEISVEGSTFTVIMALVSGVMQVKQVYQNARTVEAQIKEQTMQSIADARKQLGFADDEIINLDKAEKAYKEIAKKHHPNSSARTGDGAMHDAIFAAAQNAIEVLRKNAMSINATVTKQVTNPQTSQPAQPKANPSHIPTAEDGAIVPISHYQAQPFTNTGVVPITVNGVNLNRTITNANNAVVTSETEMVGASTVINGKDANGNIITSTVDNGTIKSIQYIDGNNTVSQIVVKDAVVANYVVNANGNGVYTDVTGQVITEEQYNKIVNEAVNGHAEQVSMPLTPAQNNGAATVVELNPQVSAVAASGSGPVADPSAVPSQVTGGAAPAKNVYEPVENISQTFAENKPRELKLPRVSGGTQADIVEGWRDFISESKAVINSATSIDELRTLRDQIKNVENKQAAQELREAYVQKEQQLRAALPESTKAVENMYRPTDSNQSTSSVSSSSVYQQLQKEPLILPGEDNRTIVYSPAARSEVIHTPTTGFKGKRLQFPKHYVVDSQAHFRLDGWFELQLNSPEIKNILDGLNPGEEITVGKQGHIKNENLYTKKHLTIKKLSDNQFEITPLGINGTEISTETIVTDAKAKISGTNNKKSYEKPQTTVMSYSMESDLMASDVQTVKYNSNQERILAEAGFSDGVIDDIIANGPWGNPKVDAALVEEVKNMIIWMEGEIANGATVNRTLIETAINTFSPGASGASAACQRSILANYWNRGTEVYNAYGQKAPGQSTFSWGNLKAKWNLFKNSVKDFYDYKKWEYGFGTDTSNNSGSTGSAAPTQSTPSQPSPSGAGVNTGVNTGVGTVQTSFVPQTAQDVHAKIVNGDFGAFGSKSAKTVGSELKAYAEKNGLKFIERGSEFELQDANGNVLREAHEGFFDGQWYDHHQTFNADNKITNRFVVDHNGKLQSTVEYFYDENGNQTMSVGYGGKAGTDVMVFEGSNRSQLTIQQFIEKYGFEPTFYREINPTVEFKSPIQTGGVTSVSSVAEMEASIKANITPMEADTGIKPFGEINELEGKELLDEPQQSSVPVDQTSSKETTEVTDKKRM